MKKFSLGMFSYPGGVQYSNRARKVRGDYESIAFVTNSGRVRWDASEAVIRRCLPHVAQRIEEDAAQMAAAFSAQLAQDIQKRPAATLDRLLDMCPAGLVVDCLGWPCGLAEKAQRLAAEMTAAGIL